MNLENLTGVILTVLGFLVLLFAIVVFTKTAWFKSAVGDALLKWRLTNSLDKRVYYAIDGTAFPVASEKHSIDYIIVSKYGVMVIEAKNMKGWIYGSEFQQKWVQKIFKHSDTFDNPLSQTNHHAKILQERLGLTDDQILSLVVFVGDSTFKTVMPINVIHSRGVIGFIKMQQRVVLSDNEVKQLIIRIEQGRLESIVSSDKLKTEDGQVTKENQAIQNRYQNVS